MELRDFALRVVTTADIDEKLTAPPAECTDADPGPALRLATPGRPPELGFDRDFNVPPPESMHDPSQRARIIHALLNHELQAVELFAWALLAFPDAPGEFRGGLLEILQDEQKHSRLYRARLEAHGMRLGEAPVTGYFWNKIDSIRSPAQFVCAMSLTFENANLDHSIEYAHAAREAGDEATARVIDTVHEDEITHVAFGWRWLREFKDSEQSMIDAYREALVWPLRAALARGTRFHPRGRERAGLDAEFIRFLAENER